MTKAVLLTSEGLKALQEELEHLKTVTRNEIAEKINIARGFGDLSENSEYDEAMNEQAKIEARIVELDAMLKNAQVIDDMDVAEGTITIGCTVKLYDVEYDEDIVYTIVGSAESDPREFKISDESPIGAALIGHCAGDEITVVCEAGHLQFKVLDVQR
ncbi:MAG: transcription elongation factor GreA [Clostridia bacterium]|nr:transcription elongation factor GreA [Clostridia bacterium]MBO5913006.1 transcription elongation factor GreA [Clostridia bacterium]